MTGKPLKERLGMLREWVVSLGICSRCLLRDLADEGKLCERCRDYNRMKSAEHHKKRMQRKNAS